MYKAERKTYKITVLQVCQLNNMHITERVQARNEMFTLSDNVN